MSGWSPDGTDSDKKEGELHLSQVIELAQYNGARFVHSNGTWQLWTDQNTQQTLYHTTSWVSLSDAAASFCLFKDIPLTTARLEADRTHAKASAERQFPDSVALRRKYEA